MGKGEGEEDALRVLKRCPLISSLNLEGRERREGGADLQRSARAIGVN